jgi:hypothetical protein
VFLDWRLILIIDEPDPSTDSMPGPQPNSGRDASYQKLIRFEEAFTRENMDKLYHIIRIWYETHDLS